MVPVDDEPGALKGGVGINIGVEPVDIGAAPASSTINGVDAARIEPTSGVVAMFAAALYAIVPFPAPLAPEVTLSQLAVLAACH
jgi:hypothetical protein